MGVVSIVKLSELEGAKRIDAEYYQPEYLVLDKKIKAIKFYSFSELIGKFSSGNNLAQVNFQSSYTPFIRTQNVRPILIDNEGLTCVDPSIDNPAVLEEGVILFVRVGEGVGNSSIVTRYWRGSSCSDNVLRVKIKYLDPYFVIAYLNSKLGEQYLERVKKGSARSLISRQNVDLIRIYEPADEVVVYCRTNILEAQKLVINSESLYSQAENLLLEELELKDFKPKYELSYSTNLSKAFEVCRVDAEYFQPVYHQLIEHLKGSFETMPLKTFILDFQKGTEVGSEKYQEEGKPFIRVSNLSIRGFVKRDQQYIDEELYQRLKDTYEPKVGDFLLTKDATPGIAYVVKEPIEGIIGSGILKLGMNESEINKEYLAFCINTVAGKMQIERDSGGSVITHWRPQQIKNLQIPILAPETQQKIASLVQESHEAKKNANELLESAKRKVQEAIR